MTSLFKLVQASKSLSSVFVFRFDYSPNKFLSFLIIILRVIFFMTIGVVILFFQALLYLLYLNMFFTSIPGALVKKIRMDSLGYDESNKWLFNISYLMLYLFVLVFELAYILINYWTIILSFTIDCLMWILTFGKTKLVNTNLSLNNKIDQSLKVKNNDIVTIIFTLFSIVLFSYVLDSLNISVDFIATWMFSSFTVLVVNVLYYRFFYFGRPKSKVKTKEEDTNHIQSKD